MYEKCRSRPASTSLPSDLDLHCSLFGKKYPMNLNNNSVDPDQAAWIWQLIWIYTVHFLVRSNLMNLNNNSVDPDQTAWIWQLIWIYTVHFLVRSNPMNLNNNSVDPDRTAWIWQLIWIYIGIKG
jgi:hypothetical protein